MLAKIRDMLPHLAAGTLKNGESLYSFVQSFRFVRANGSLRIRNGCVVRGMHLFASVGEGHHRSGLLRTSKRGTDAEQKQPCIHHNRMEREGNVITAGDMYV